MRVSITLCLLLLAACSSEAPPPPAEPAPRTPTVFDDQLQAMEKAKAVEDMDKKRLEEMDKQVDGQ